jgi:hypothetical protein
MSMHDFTKAEVGKYVGKIAPGVPAFAPVPPVGQRPRCLFCTRELRPNFTDPDRTSTGEGYLAWFKMTLAERKAWRKTHPKVFLGTYGTYGDSRFCGLNCGYRWALQHCTVDTMIGGRKWR